MEEPTGKKANIIVTCSDARITYWLNQTDFKSKLGLLDTFSSLRNTGSIKFYLNENLMDKLFKQLDVLVNNYHPEKIVLMNHTDCGYYKSLGQDNSEVYFGDLKLVGRMILQKYPDLSVEGYLLDTETGELKTS